MDRRWFGGPMESNDGQDQYQDLPSQSQAEYNSSTWNIPFNNENDEVHNGTVPDDHYIDAARTANSEEHQQYRLQNPHSLSTTFSPSDMTRYPHNVSDVGARFPSFDDYSIAQTSLDNNFNEGVDSREHQFSNSLLHNSTFQARYQENLHNSSFNDFNMEDNDGFDGMQRNEVRDRGASVTHRRFYQSQKETQDRRHSKSDHTSVASANDTIDQHGHSGLARMMQGHSERADEMEMGRSPQRTDLSSSPDPVTPISGHRGKDVLPGDDLEEYGRRDWDFFIKPDDQPPIASRPPRLLQPQDPDENGAPNPEVHDILDLVGDDPGMQIRSIEEYKQSIDARAKCLLSDMRSDGENFDIDDQTLVIWVGRLYNAFLNMERIIDKPIKNGKPAQSAARIANGWYPCVEIEKVCWKIVLGAVDAQYNVPLVELHHGCTWEHNGTHEDFEQRMRKIVKVCYMSKAMCKQLLDPPYWHRLVDAPEHELVVKLANKKLNDTRDIHNEIGRKALQKGLQKFNLDENEVPTTPTPAKRRRIGPPSKPSATGPGKRIASGSPIPVRKVKQLQSTPTKTQTKPGGGTDHNDDSDNEDALPLAKRKRLDRAVQPLEANAGLTAVGGNVDISVGDDLPTGDLTAVRSQVRTMSLDVEDSLMNDPASVGDQTTQAEHDAVSNTAPGSVPGVATARVSELSIGEPESMGVPSVSHSSATSEGVTPPSQHDPRDSNDPTRRTSPVSRICGPGVNVAMATIPSLPVASDALDDSRKAYKEAICDILEVNKELINNYTLEDLRTYARAYNRKFQDQHWIPDTDNKTGHLINCKALSQNVFTATGNSVGHFGYVVQKFAQLAIARGDFNANGSVNLQSSHLYGFTTNGNVEYDKALGVLPNDFGQTPFCRIDNSKATSRK